MDEFKKVTVPVASHGLHRHKINEPYLGTGRFMEMFPVFYFPIYRGEKLPDLKAGVFSLLQPTSVPAFFTGRYHFKSVFVPYTYVFKPWYHFRQGIKYKKVDGTSTIISQSPNCTQLELSKAFLGMTDGDYALVTREVSHPDILHYIGSSEVVGYKLTTLGCRVLKILNGLGISPTWVYNDYEPVKLLNVFCYLRAFMDLCFPGQYVGTQFYTDIDSVIQLERFDYNDTPYLTNLLTQLAKCSSIFYDRSDFDYVWDTPSGPSANTGSNPISISDQTYAASPGWTSVFAPNITNDHLNDPSDYVPNNGAFIGNVPDEAGSDGFVGRITKFGLSALESIANYMRRRQLVGSRLVDNFLAEHGIHLGSPAANMAYNLSDQYVEINISQVENNSNTNLGELAGKGIAKTDEQSGPLKFECKPDDDGCFIILCCIEPDADLPVYNDPSNSQMYQNDFRSEKFDKLGVEGVRQNSVFNDLNGSHNRAIVDKLFGFWNRYAGDVIKRPRLTGDFRIPSRGAEDLSAYHAFRIFNSENISLNNGVYHSLDFVRGSSDMDQYQRMFYSSEIDNLILYIRWFGSVELTKLPVGDSFDWSDDEFNKKVTLVNQGLK